MKTLKDIAELIKVAYKNENEDKQIEALNEIEYTFGGNAYFANSHTGISLYFENITFNEIEKEFILDLEIKEQLTTFVFEENGVDSFEEYFEETGNKEITFNLRVSDHFSKKGFRGLSIVNNHINIEGMIL